MLPRKTESYKTAIKFTEFIMAIAILKGYFPWALRFSSGDVGFSPRGMMLCKPPVNMRHLVDIVLNLYLIIFNCFGKLIDKGCL